ncbi:MAG: hypothetical protein ACETWK_04515 [Candidatus Aminicenantaceae bacterium]
MKRIFPHFILSFLLIFLTFCGTKGPIVAPVKKIPQKVEGFTVVQRGNNIILTWKNPKNYTDGNPLVEIKEIEIWLLEEQKESDETEWELLLEESQTPPEISLEEFKNKAKLMFAIEKDTFPEYQITKDEDPAEFEYFLPLTPEQLSSGRFTFALKVQDEKKKESEFSDLISIEPRLVPHPPPEVQSTLFKDRIEIKWRIPLKNIDNSSTARVKGYNIYRKNEEEEYPRKLNSSLIREEELSEKDFLFSKAYYLFFKAYSFLAKERIFIDKNFQFGEKYQYFVRACLEESSPFWESSDSEVVEILVEDTFAPAPPSGLISVAGSNFVSMSWEANREEDLAGYRVWRRSEEQGEFTLLTKNPIRENVYSDSTVEKNKRYYYAITAQDESGNESKKSESISEMIKEESS